MYIPEDNDSKILIQKKKDTRFKDLDSKSIWRYQLNEHMKIWSSEDINFSKIFIFVIYLM